MLSQTSLKNSPRSLPLRRCVLAKCDVIRLTADLLPRAWASGCRLGISPHPGLMASSKRLRCLLTIRLHYGERRTPRTQELNEQGLYAGQKSRATQRRNSRAHAAAAAARTTVARSGWMLRLFVKSGTSSREKRGSPRSVVTLRRGHKPNVNAAFFLPAGSLGSPLGCASGYTAEGEGGGGGRAHSVARQAGAAAQRPDRVVDKILSVLRNEGGGRARRSVTTAR